MKERDSGRVPKKKEEGNKDKKMGSRRKMKGIERNGRYVWKMEMNAFRKMMRITNNGRNKER